MWLGAIAPMALGAGGFWLGYKVMTFGAGYQCPSAVLEGPEPPAYCYSASFARMPEFLVWALVVAGETAFWGAVAFPLWQWSIRMMKDYRLSWWSLGWALLLTVSLFSAFLIDHQNLIATSYLYDNNRKISFLAVVGVLSVALPASLGLRGVKLAAEKKKHTEAAPEERGIIADHVGLRSQLRGFLAVAGGLIGFVVIATGAQLNAVRAFEESEFSQVSSNSPQLVLVYGGLLAGVLALVYFPAFAALQRQGRAIVDDLCQLPPVASPAFTKTVEKRAQLAGLLGLETTAKQSFEDGVLILTPLIGGVFSTFLSGGGS